MTEVIAKDMFVNIEQAYTKDASPDYIRVRFAEIQVSTESAVIEKPESAAWLEKSG